MRKRVILSTLLLAMVLGLAACGGKTSDTNKADVNTTVEAEDTSREADANTTVEAEDTSREVAFNTDVDSSQKETGDNDTKTETELKLEITDPADGLILSFGADSFTLPVSVKELKEKGIEYTGYDKDLFPDDEAFDVTVELMYKGWWWRDIKMFLFNDISRSNNLEESLLLTGFSVDMNTYVKNAFENGMLDPTVAEFAINGLALGQELTNEDIEKLESFGFVIPEEHGWARMIDMNGTTEYACYQETQYLSIAIQDGVLVAFSVLCW